jgi:DUF4097 and DUF4098 domain-containing protein YvlB
MGNVRADTSNGGIQVSGSNGKLELETNNGDIQAEGGKETVDLKTSNGKIRLKTAGAVVAATTSNGGIETEGKLGAGTNTLETSNGPIVLKLPAHSQFRLEADAGNGSVHCDCPVTEEGQTTKTHLHGQVGENPQTTIKVHTSNGIIHIERGPE